MYVMSRWPPVFWEAVFKIDNSEKTMYTTYIYVYVFIHKVPFLFFFQLI